MNTRRFAISSSLFLSACLCADAVYAAKNSPPPPSFSGTRPYQQYQSTARPVPSNSALRGHLAPGQGTLNVKKTDIQKNGKQNILTPNFAAQAGQKGVVPVHPPNGSNKTDKATAAYNPPGPRIDPPRRR